MRILFDTNILIDAAVQSRVHHDTANRLLVHAGQGAIDGVTTPTAITTCWYVSTATYGVDPRPLFEYLSTVFDLARMGWPALSRALEAPAEADFEDAYLAAAGAAAGASIVATRNETDFENTSLTPYHPLDLVEMLTQ